MTSSILALLADVIIGAEGEEESSTSEDGVESGGSHTEGEGGSQEEHGDSEDPNIKGLKTALSKERARADKAEKALRAADKAKADKDLAEKTELEQSQIREQASKDRITRLAAGVLQSEINRAISSAASKAGFADPEDAVALIDRSLIEATQDEEDPSLVEIDMKSVEAQVKALAAKKPHFLKAGTSDGEPTGGQFGGAKKQKQTSDEVLRGKYPSLR